jgi:hypothetical protein
MSRRIHLSAFLTLLILVATGRGAGATIRTIDTFGFGYPAASWFDYNDSGDVQPTVFGLQGFFTGTVESDGSIQLKDLSSLTIQILIPHLVNLSASDLTAFSFFPTGGPSSLDFIASSPAVPILTCGGLSVGLFAPCNNFGRIPGDAFASVFIDQPVWTLTPPTVELMSSVTVPEPSTWAMFLAGFAGIGFVGAISRRRGARLLY